eukprot:TRINITY_DN7296_c0_g1_i1.p1 TRINITY_DN7296_c0_g1~~TRINITY_DN7296_c0_g1_i1.p1  ORF type:complete len:707 (+),score=162.69 TRINITY_DN7296_c0_g1_i1:41-2122(+)
MDIEDLEVLWQELLPDGQTFLSSNLFCVGLRRFSPTAVPELVTSVLGNPSKITYAAFHQFFGLFGPKTMIDENVKAFFHFNEKANTYTMRPWFKGAISRHEADEILEGRPAGCFIVRFSDSHPNKFALQYVFHHKATNTRKVQSTLVSNSPEGYHLVQKNDDGTRHRTILALLRGLHPLGLDHTIMDTNIVDAHDSKEWGPSIGIHVRPSLGMGIDDDDEFDDDLSLPDLPPELPPHIDSSYDILPQFSSGYEALPQKTMLEVQESSDCNYSALPTAQFDSLSNPVSSSILNNSESTNISRNDYVNVNMSSDQMNILPFGSSSPSIVESTNVGIAEDEFCGYGSLETCVPPDSNVCPYGGLTCCVGGDDSIAPYHIPSSEDFGLTYGNASFHSEGVRALGESQTFTSEQVNDAIDEVETQLARFRSALFKTPSISDQEVKRILDDAIPILDAIPPSFSRYRPEIRILRSRVLINTGLFVAKKREARREALSYFNEAEQLLKALPPPNDIRGRLYNNIGRVLLNLKRPVEAYDNFIKCLRDVEDIKNRRPIVELVQQMKAKGDLSHICHINEEYLLESIQNAETPISEALGHCRCLDFKELESKLLLKLTHQYSNLKEEKNNNNNPENNDNDDNFDEHESTTSIPIPSTNSDCEENLNKEKCAYCLEHLKQIYIEQEDEDGIDKVDEMMAKLSI